MTNEEMMKSLTSLIEESLAEIEELKKSDRFSASEIKMGDSEGLAGKDKNGSLGKEEEKEDDEDEKEEAEKAEAEEAEKAEDCDDEMDKKEDDEDDEEEEKEMKKSLEESFASQETLMKSYVDERVSGLEGKIDALTKAIQELAEAPVPSRGATFKSVKPLAKSEPEPEPLSKSDVVNKLFELKKSGEKVDTVDIASAELGSPQDLIKLVNKYNIK